MRAIFITLMIFFCSLAPSSAEHRLREPQIRTKESQRVASVARALAATYDPDTGLFRGTGWWNSANGISALANVSRELRTTEFEPLFENTFKLAQEKNPDFLNEFYDDEGWWALAWLDVHEVDNNPRYLEMSKSIFTDMSHGWSDTCGGGIWWKKNEHYKNAIANELFLSVAVRLAEASSGEERAHYLAWARREEQWFVHSGMVNADSLINDGLDGSCKNNHGITWSYNQGVILTGLARFSMITEDASALTLAQKIAQAAGTKLVDADGILHDPCEPKCGEDGVQFKGILIRNLVTLQQAKPTIEIPSLLNRNANSVWTKARTKQKSFSVDWAGPPENDGTGSLISALDALTAPLRLHP